MKNILFALLFAPLTLLAQSSIVTAPKSNSIVCVSRTVTVPCWGGMVFEWTYSQSVFGTNGTMTSWRDGGEDPTFTVVRIEHEQSLVRFFNGDKLHALYDSIIGLITVFDHDTGAFTTYHAAK